jgi:hypothetical protein
MLADFIDPEGTLDVEVDVGADAETTVDEAVPEDAEPVDDDDNDEENEGNDDTDEVGRGIVVKPRTMTGGPILARGVTVLEIDDVDEVEVEVDEVVLVLDPLDLDDELEVLDEELNDDADVVVLGSWPAFTGLSPFPAPLSTCVNEHSFTSCTKA